MKVINLFAGPGAGKSTTAAGLFYQMKMNKFKVELVTEYAKDLVYADRTDMFASQDYIFAKQRHRIERLEGKVDWVITDSPLLLSLVYPADFWDKPLVKAFSKFVLTFNNKYDNINYCLQRRKDYQEFGRKHSEEDAIKLDNRICSMLMENKIKFDIINKEDDAPGQIYTDVVMIENDS
jgi:hypothetical protein